MSAYGPIKIRDYNEPKKVFIAPATSPAVHKGSGNGIYITTTANFAYSLDEYEPGTIYKLDTNSFTLLWVAEPANLGRVKDIISFPEASSVLSYGTDSKLMLWDDTDGSLVTQHELPHDDEIPFVTAARIPGTTDLICADYRHTIYRVALSISENSEINNLREELKRLDQLLESGTISQKEYESLRKLKIDSFSH